MLIRLLVGSFMLTFAMNSSGAPELVARKITSTADLPRGRGALGKTGDYLLANDRIRVVIDDIGKRQGFAEGGGTIIDVTLREVNLDTFTQLFTYFNNTFPRQAIYDRLEILKDGSDGQAAVIRVSGSELKDRNIKVVTDYSLHPGESSVLVETTLTNTGSEPIKNFKLGDAVQWGYTEHFAPGTGYDLGGRTLSNLEWLAGTGEGASYGYTIKSGTFSGPNGSNWSDANVKTANLDPNVPVSYGRYLIVGTGDIASITDQVYAIRAQPTGTLLGQIAEEGTRSAVTGASILIQTADGRPFNLVKPKPDGSFRMSLPAGDYRLVASALGRTAPAPVGISVRQGTDCSATLSLGQSGRLEFTIRDAATNKLIPGKVTFTGLGNTPDPVLGPGYVARGAMNVVFNSTGRGDTLIPPGFYSVTVSRGIEYTIDQKRIVVEAGKKTTIEALLKRVVETPGYISADFHLHSEYSPDSNISLKDKVTGLVAEGVEFGVSTDHNNIADYKAAIHDLGLERELKSSIGDEVTLSGLIHFNVFPLELHPDRPRHGAIDPAKMKVQDMIDAVRKDPGEEVVQLNHPRFGNIGYFATSKFDSSKVHSPDPDFTLDFDAIEVLNGKHLSEGIEVLHDWFNLLNAGYRMTATGNSDAHKLVSEEAGYPRNFVFLGKDDPAQIDEDELVAAVKAHHVIVSNGPFLTVKANDQDVVGDVISGGGKPVTFTVKLQSAPWVDVSEVSLWGNGERIESRLVQESTQADRGTVTFTVTPKSDTWYVLVVRGNKALAPVVPNLGDTEVLPFAFTNPIWVDGDGDGKFTPPRPRK